MHSPPEPPVKRRRGNPNMRIGGPSVNPGGRPKSYPELRALCQEKTIAGVERIYEILNGRVEERRGCLGHAATLRFLSPLIEPDMQISSIRLSDKTSRLRPRLVVAKPAQTYESEVPARAQRARLRRARLCYPDRRPSRRAPGLGYPGALARFTLARWA